MIRAIETQYNGYRFRSRLEARWAVFFDTLNVPYEYEKEGFELEDGTRYLPDFWLPHLELWVEIKGKLTWKTKQYKWGSVRYSPELELGETFKNAQEWPIAVVEGTPGKETIHFYGWDLTDSSGGSYYDDMSQWCMSNGIVTLNVNSGKDRVFISDNLMGKVMPQFEYPWEYGYTRDKITNAAKAARSARFEHGERGILQ